MNFCWLLWALVFVSRLSGDECIHHNFQTIDSNIAADTADDKFDQAKVIILLELHETNGGQIPNAELLNRFWQEGDQLLTEGFDEANFGTPCTVCLLHKPEIAQQYESWDLPDKLDASRLFQGSFDQLVYSLRLLEHLCYESILMHHRINLPEGYDEKLNELTGVSDIASRSFEERYEYVHGLIPLVEENSAVFEKTLLEEVYKTFIERNIHMVMKINENLERYSRVWVIAGASHGQYTEPETIESVQLLYDCLNQKGIPYITLYARKTPGILSERELEGKSLNDPSDFLWNTNERKEALAQEQRRSFQQYEEETRVFSTQEEWAEWILASRLSETQKFLDELEHNGYSAISKLSYFIEFSLAKIYNDEVLLLGRDPNLSRHHISRGK